MCSAQARAHQHLAEQHHEAHEIGTEVGRLQRAQGLLDKAMVLARTLGSPQYVPW